jgi:hypoxanthine phosphoribosyltransferase
MARRVGEVLVSRETIARMVETVGARISRDYQGREVLLVCVLKGACVFLSDLMRRLDVPVKIDFMSVSSYGAGTETTGTVRILRDLDTDIAGKHVIVVEDIVDTGLTLRYLKEMLSTRHPASIAVCAAFDKPARRKVDVEVEYVGMEIPDAFIVGYGLDLDGRYRNLPDVRVMTDDDGQGGTP